MSCHASLRHDVLSTGGFETLEEVRIGPHLAAPLLMWLPHPPVLLLGDFAIPEFADHRIFRQTTIRTSRKHSHMHVPGVASLMNRCELGLAVRYPGC